MARTLKNVKLKDFRRFLESRGLKMIRTSGGHEVWSGKNLLRPIVLQTHIDPIPLFVVLNNLRTAGCTKEDLIEYLEKK